MNWQEVCETPNLKDLQYRIELNKLGQIVMSPASNEHSFRQSRIIRNLLRIFSQGEVLPECSIDTKDGVKVADVVWLSDGFLSQYGMATPFPSAPEICVEVLSPSNTEEEMRIKRELYFQQGAQEVWLCDENGALAFFSPQGLMEHSKLAASFPKSI